MKSVLDGREFGAFLHSFSEGIVLTDASLFLRWINPLAENILGVSAQEWEGNSIESLLQKRPDLAWVFEEKQTEPYRCWEVMQCEDNACPLWGKSFTDCWTQKACPYCRSNSRDDMEDGSIQGKCPHCKIYHSYVFQREKEITRANDEKLTLQVHTTPLCDQSGPVIGKIHMLRDVTQDKELGRLKDDFLSALAHELRSPLTSIRSYTEILLHYADTEPETQKEFLRIIHSESERLDHMIEDMMELQQLESARSVWNNKDVYIPELIQRVLQDYKSTLQKKNITCKMEMDPQAPNVWTDSDKMYHVIFTLLRNLANQTSPGGTILIKAFPMKGQRKTDKSYFIKFTLSTTRTPTPPPEEKGDAPPPRQGEFSAGRKKGLGLGFTLCKTILDQYGGNLWMEDGEGESGLTFHFTLPSSTAFRKEFVDEEEISEIVESHETEPVIEKSTKRILIVDDDPGLLNALTFALQKEGYRVHSTTSVRRALEMVMEAKPDLIISDIRMPEMDGYAFFQEIQDDESTKMIPFIFISGKKETGDRIRGFKTGVDDYLTKPFDIKELAARVEALLIKVERYKDLSRFDSLTGALNRKTFDEQINKTVLRAQRERIPVSMVMADLDHFKKVNDTHGHLAGDFVLRSLVDFFQKNLREEDILARYGGEEFCIIMPGVQKGMAREILERIRKQLAETQFHYEKDDLHITLTCSFGVSGFPNDSANAKGLIEKSDTALYEAKNAGRNRVVLYGEGV